MQTEVTLFYDGVKKLVTEPLGATIYGSEGGNAILYLYADEGDDDADKWLIRADTTAQLEIQHKTSGSWVPRVQWDSSGHQLPGTDSTYNIGSNSNRYANIYADTLYGDGSNLTGIAAGGGDFNTSISEYATGTVSNSMATVFTSNASSSHRTIIHSCRVANYGSSDVRVSGQLYGAYAFAHLIPIPAGSAVELFKKPKVMGASQTLQLQSSASSSLQVTVSAERQENTDLSYGAVDLSSTSETDIVTLSAAAVVESILLCNDDGTNDVKIQVKWTDGSNSGQSILCKDMVVPAGATVELLEKPLAMPSGHKLRATANQANRCEVIAALKYAS